MKDGKRRAFPDFSTFLLWNFTMRDVQQLSQSLLNSIPLDDPLPKLSKNKSD